MNIHEWYGCVAGTYDELSRHQKWDGHPTESGTYRCNQRLMEVPFLSLVRIPLFAGSVSPYWWSNRHFGDFKSYEHCFIPGHSKPVLVASNPWQPWLRFCCCISFLCWWMPFLLLANVLEFSASFPFIASKKSCRPVGEVYRYEPPFKSI